MRFYHTVNGRLSPEDVHDIVRATVASNRLSGMDTPPDEVEMLRRFLAGEISEAEYDAWALAVYIHAFNVYIHVPVMGLDKNEGCGIS